MLDVVQAHFLTSTLTSFFPHGPSEKRRRNVDVADALDGIVVEDDLHGQGIVEVDPEGFPFVPIEPAHRCPRQPPDVVIVGGAVGCRDLAVTKKGYPIGPVDQIGFQEPVPGRVAYLQYGGGSFSVECCDSSDLGAARAGPRKAKRLLRTGLP